MRKWYPSYATEPLVPEVAFFLIFQCLGHEFCTIVAGCYGEDLWPSNCKHLISLMTPYTITHDLSAVDQASHLHLFQRQNEMLRWKWWIFRYEWSLNINENGKAFSLLKGKKFQFCSVNIDDFRRLCSSTVLRLVNWFLRRYILYSPTVLMSWSECKIIRFRSMNRSRLMPSRWRTVSEIIFWSRQRPARSSLMFCSSGSSTECRRKRLWWLNILKNQELV